MVPPPMPGQYPLETRLQKLLHRANLLRPRVPAVIVKGGKHVFVFIPSEMIAGEKKTILVEQAHMAPGMPRHRNNGQIMIKLNCFSSADDFFHIVQTSTGVCTVHNSLAVKVLLKQLVIGHIITMGENHPPHSTHFFQSL